MKNVSKLLALLLAVALVVSSLAACTTNQGSAEPSTDAPVESSTEEGVVYERADDEDVYEANIGEYPGMIRAAKEMTDLNAKFVKMAEAEAYLLDQAVMIPYSTQGGNYSISRVAPHTVPYVQWGNDDDRLKGLVISDEFLTKEERADLLAQWKEALSGATTYDPAKYLTDKGHTLQTTYTTTFSTAPVTLDWFNTSSQSDTEILVNTVDGLVEYDNLNRLNPAIAETWESSEDGLTYTFHLRKGVKWYTSEGTEYAEVTANDFVNGLRHIMDVQEGLEYLLGADGAHIVNADEYVAGEVVDFAEVGVKAVDDYTLQYTLTQPTSYFMTMLAYTIFLPLCSSFYEARGGVYGVEEYKALVDEDSENAANYTFGQATDVASQVYNGAYLLQKLVKESEIEIVKNPNYYRVDEVRLEKIRWTYDNGENPDAVYDDAVKGTYAGVGLGVSTGLLKRAQEDGNFDKYSYVTDTTSTTYFGGLNLNRGTFGLANGAGVSPKDEQQKIDTNTALQNKNFRKALLHAWNLKEFNAVSRGEELAETNIRNMYTHPEFVVLDADVTDEYGQKFTAGMTYGECVQVYLDKLGCKVKVADGHDGWYNQEAVEEYKAAAKAELGDTVTFPIQIDVVYYSPSKAQVANANAYKEIVEGNLGTDFVQVNLIETTVSDDFYALGYRAKTGDALGSDIFWGSGWGPDYGDPSTYLDTFLSGGYMIKVVGINGF